ncbi:NAD(P)-dependent oxidoreductase [Nonomuraea sp. B10E15]|uniref:NAD(P)-dependent oxidoreductase n=1 Tax=Nonomuraea sp. B10E15 TaxID=3153560 RepID=UPI00325DCDCC
MADNMWEPVCVVGLGAMGGAVAARLAAAGREVVGYDLDEVAVRRAAEAGVTVSAGPAEAVTGARTVITSLPDAAAVRAAWCGPGGLVRHAAPGTFAVELSTIDPGTMREIAVPARAAGLRVVDCAVSGGPEEAAAGALALIAGAWEADLRDLEPLLGRIGTSVAHTGDVGTGKVVKLVNNLMSMANVLVAAEAFQIGVAAGVEPERLFDVLSRSGGRSHHFTKRFPWAIAGDFRPRFTVALGEKDLGLGLDLARSVGVPAPAASVARSMYAMAVAEGLAGQDIVALNRLYQRWAERAHE